jgi:hypothetical protein
MLQAARVAGKCGAGLRCETDIQLQPELSCLLSWGFSWGFSWVLELPTYST